MRRYIEHLKTKEPHERRKHAAQWAGAIVGLFFVVWVATFSTRLATPPQSGDTDPAQTAAAANATMIPQSAAALQVSTSSVYSY